MALMYADGAMFLGNGTDTNEQHSLIGSTIRTFVQILASANLLTVLPNNDTVLTNEITFLSTLGEAVAIAIKVPESANTMQLVFGYFNAMNSWYWAIDNITLSSAGGIIFREDFEGLNLSHSIDEGSEFDVSFSPDGRNILSTQNDAQIFDANTGENLHRFYQWPGIAYSKFNHDGSYLYTVTKGLQGFDRKMALWSMKDFKKEKEYKSLDEDNDDAYLNQPWADTK